MTRKRHPGHSLAGLYLFFFALSGLYALYRLIFHTATSEFSGLPALVVTLPTSLWLAPFFNKIGYVQWYERFGGRPFVYGLFALSTMLPSALINAAILFFFGRLFSKSPKSAKI